MGAQCSSQCSCEKSGESCADKVVETFRTVETVVHAAENGYDHSALMLHESLPNQELIRAAMEGREQSVARQLERGAFIETRRPFAVAFEGDLGPFRSQADMGLTPLMHAALGGHAETCAVLLTAGAQVNAQDEDKMQPLHFAAKAGNFDVFKLLLHARADANCQDRDGLTPLAQLAPWSKSSKADFEALVTTESGSFLSPMAAGRTAGAAAAAVAAEASTPDTGEVAFSSTATHGTPGSQDLHLLDQEPTLAELPACTSALALDDRNTCGRLYVFEANLAAIDTQSDETAIPEGLLWEPSWMARELTLPLADSLHVAGEGGKEANSVQDELTEADKCHNEGNSEIPESLPADSPQKADEAGEAASLQDGLMEVGELHNEADVEIAESMLSQPENEASWAPL